MKTKINGRTYSKSSHSGGSACVGIAIEKDKIYVTNTITKKDVVEFTKEEWTAFVKGVKDGEFDIE